MWELLRQLQRVNLQFSYKKYVRTVYLNNVMMYNKKSGASNMYVLRYKWK